MAKARELSEAERKVIQETVDRVRRFPFGTSQRPIVRNDLSEAPDVYLARTPAAGLVPLTIGDDVGTGSGSVSTSLFNSGLADTLPVAQGCCQVYRVMDLGSGPQILEAPIPPVCVCNMSSDPIPGNCWVWIQRDKYGMWFVSSVITPMEGWVQVHTLSSTNGKWPGSLYTRDFVYIEEIWTDAVNAGEPLLNWYYWGVRRDNVDGRPCYTVNPGGEFMTAWECLSGVPHNIYATGPSS